MARPLRIEFHGAVYHVTSRGNARQKLYRDDKDREAFLTALARVAERFGWICHAHYLMDKHFHLLIETPCAQKWSECRNATRGANTGRRSD